MNNLSRLELAIRPPIATVALALACAAGAFFVPPAPARAADPPPLRDTYGIVVHGGAGDVVPERVPPDLAQAYRAKMEEALRAGHRVLEGGGPALDAVEAAVRILEDAPEFNAGRGAVFNSAGENELDASIMDGRTLDGGAVAAVKRVKNPISLARAVMEGSPHVMMAGEGAESFAREQGLELVSPDYFFTTRRWADLLKRQRREAEASERRPKPRGGGTVGAVALDRHGNLAAATSTGGLTNKRFGRVGDSPVIGAGTYAHNPTCAVSGTGHGEFFIRAAVAHDISARMAYGGATLEAAARAVVMEKLVAMKGRGGVIAIDKDGNVALPFNTRSMKRGYILGAGEPVIELFGDREEEADVDGCGG